MTDYVKFRALATRLIDKAGRSITLERLSDAVLDTSKPWRGAGAPTVIETRQVRAVFVPIGGEKLSAIITDISLFASSEKTLIVAGIEGVDLNAFHVVIDNNIPYKIDVSQELAPGPVVVLYAMGVSK